MIKGVPHSDFLALSEAPNRTNESKKKTQWNLELFNDLMKEILLEQLLKFIKRNKRDLGNCCKAWIRHGISHVGAELGNQCKRADSAHNDFRFARMSLNFFSAKWTSCRGQLKSRF